MDVLPGMKTYLVAATGVLWAWASVLLGTGTIATAIERTIQALNLIGIRLQVEGAKVDTHALAILMIVFAWTGYAIGVHDVNKAVELTMQALASMGLSLGVSRSWVEPKSAK